MQKIEPQPTRGRCGIVCRIIWETISFLVITAAIAVNIALATRGSKYSIAAAAVLVCLAVVFIVFPVVACGVVCCYKAGKYESGALCTALVWSLAIVFRMAPFFLVTAAALSIVELTKGKGEDNASLETLAVLATILNVVATVASIFLCITTCVYVCRRRPATATEECEQEEEQLVIKESKLSETEVKEKD